jgi:hypothetical protein
MTPAAAIAVALNFIWLGMVLAISFVEAPLKFRAPGVTLQIGLAIGRRVFRALNGIEVALAVGIAIALVVARPGAAVVVAVLALAGQVLGVRPRLARRSDAVLAGGPELAAQARSRVHYVYVGLELIKLIALITAGTVLLAG